MATESLAVVIPAFNSAATIECAIVSAQDAGASEVIVVDDGSTDQTARLAETLGCIVITQRNQGAAVARRNGIVAVTASRVILLDADDALIARGVAAAGAVLDRDPEQDVVVGSMIGVTSADDRGKPLPQWPEGVTTATLVARGHAPAPPASIQWRTEALRRVFDSPELDALWPRYAEDYEILLRASLLCHVVTISEPVSRYMVTGGKSSKASATAVQDAELLRLHYARQAGIPVRPRSKRQLRSVILMKKASEFQGPDARRSRLKYLVGAALLDPREMAKRAVRRARLTSSKRQQAPVVGGWKYLRADITANPRDPKAFLVLVLFRCCQAWMGDPRFPRKSSLPAVITYRFITEFLLGIELRPKTQVGPGLSIYHGFGLVVNDHAIIGAGVKLRNGVTIGHKTRHGGSPIIGNNVEIGAGATILGEIVVGDNAVIGAGAVVVKDVPPGTTVIGNPAHLITPSSAQA